MATMLVPAKGLAYPIQIKPPAPVFTAHSIGFVTLWMLANPFFGFVSLVAIPAWTVTSLTMSAVIGVVVKSLQMPGKG